MLVLRLVPCDVSVFGGCPRFFSRGRKWVPAEGGLEGQEFGSPSITVGGRTPHPLRGTAPHPHPPPCEVARPSLGQRTHTPALPCEATLSRSGVPIPCISLLFLPENKQKDVTSYKLLLFHYSSCCKNSFNQEARLRSFCKHFLSWKDKLFFFSVAIFLFREEEATGLWSRGWMCGVPSVLPSLALPASASFACGLTRWMAPAALAEGPSRTKIKAGMWEGAGSTLEKHSLL